MGVKNGMFMGSAKALCTDLVTIPYDFEGYKKVSQILYDTVARYEKFSILYIPVHLFYISLLYVFYGNTYIVYI